MSVSLTYGNPNTGIVLVQPVDDHDMSVMDSEVRYIRELTDQEFGLIAVKVRNWNTDLSPWVAPAAFGNEGFGNGAADTLTEIMKLIKDPCKTYIIGGYSLAGTELWCDCFGKDGGKHDITGTAGLFQRE